ncbi:MAG: AmmeMemoRadiSam system radical SAM enzyme [Candidatus Omnitrophica bacterium]|nr:AmmeMemoRadiSam system radical SAM enzyme [Candidatus Omnitrophota bacterium]
MKEARFYTKIENQSVQCFLCAHRCRINEGKVGFCGVRQNRSGVLYSLVYGQPIAMHVDPIEKKPLYHCLPGSHSFSVATVGCNFRCGFCQNWEISQVKLAGANALADTMIAPEKIVEAACKNHCKSISYTYTEPTIFLEYALDIAQKAKEKGLLNILVTNGYITGEALEIAAPFIDAANVDLKFFRDEQYRKICAGSLDPVLDTIRRMKQRGIWVEVTTLVVPGENDSDEELSSLAQFMASVDKHMPWHISRFFPQYEFGDRQITSEARLHRAQELGIQAGLTYIYVGNISGLGSDTYCHACHKQLIHREGFTVVSNAIQGKQCSFCQSEIPGIWVAGSNNHSGKQ